MDKITPLGQGLSITESAPRTMDDVKQALDLLALKKAALSRLESGVKAEEGRVKDAFMMLTEGMDSAKADSATFGSKAYINRAKGRPGGGRSTRFTAYDEDACVRWVDEHQDRCLDFCHEYPVKFCEWWFESTGELPDGCDAMVIEDPGRPAYARITVKGDDVLSMWADAGMELSGRLLGIEAPAGGSEGQVA